MLMRLSKTWELGVFVPTAALAEQIRRMVEANEDWIPEADGVDASVHIVVNDFSDGVWLCAHHDECNMHKFTRLQRLA
jgi:hypothetical protein